jgi:hypothetical protein
MKMGNENSGKRVYSVNKKFFREWSPNMAYILGFTCADGCVHGRTLSWELSNKFPSDKLLLERFSKELDSNYQVEERLKSYRLRINSTFLVRYLERLGIVPNKTKILKFPKVPKNLLRHFIRGFLDGDGWISMRNSRKSNEINLGFTNGSKIFMKSLIKQIGNNIDVKTLNLRASSKLTKKGIQSIYYKIDFYSNDANNIIKYLFDGLTDKDLFLIRKYEKQVLARELFEKSQRIVKFGKKWVEIERENNVNINQELVRMFSKEKLLPEEISLKFGVSLATIYRWLEKIDLRIPAKKGSLEWRRRIFGGINE